MKRISKIVLSALSICLLGGMTTACGSSFVGDDSYTIKDVTTKKDDDGNTTVTISFNEDKTPVVFTIDKGTAGENGNGIANVTATTTTNGEVVLTITYTDTTMAPTQITVPVVKGTDGVSIVDVDVATDTNGNTVITFKYSDGKTSKPITIPKAKDGVGIAGITSTTNTDGSITLTVTFTDSTRAPVTLTIPKGNDGTSILRIESTQDGSNYNLTITFSDGSVQKITFAAPTTTQWLSGTADPDDTLGANGDFYMNTSNGGIFEKEGGSWTFIVRLWQNAAAYYYVTFDPNGGTIDGSTTNIRQKVKAGDYITDLPTPTLTGKTFQGWWTSIAEDPNAGHFTVLTPIFRDMTLYARWSA